MLDLVDMDVDLVAWVYVVAIDWSDWVGFEKG